MFLESEMRIKSGRTNQGQSWFSEECGLFCSLADSTFTDMIQRIFNGSILFHEIEAIVQKKSQVEKLCTASSQHNLDDVKSMLDRRNKERNAFKHHKAILDSFCRELDICNLNIDGKLAM